VTGAEPTFGAGYIVAYIHAVGLDSNEDAIDVTVGKTSDVYEPTPTPTPYPTPINHEPVPTVSPLGILLLVGLLATAGFVIVRRRE